ncbi:MAG: patatin-like phospholipase family protein [Bacteroidales bacterium]
MSLSIFAQRPKVGVVLSGGGAKGVSHIGALKVLEENHIPIDYIVGTSMGSIVGGLYAIGYSATELDSLVRAQDWSVVMSDKIPRSEASFEDKKYGEKFVLKIPFGKDSFGEKSKIKNDNLFVSGDILSNFPMSIISGQNIYNLFTRLSVGYQDSMDFNQMPIPFACVAVDLLSRKEVIFRSGVFVQAIRSSMAIPGVFDPVRLNGMVLVDGGVKNNFPVDVARKMGADIIIGIKMKEPKVKVKTVESIGDVFNELMGMLMDEKIQKAVEMTDVLITPDVEGYGTMSFDKQSIAVLIKNGEVAAREKEPELVRLKKYLDEQEKLANNVFVGPEYKRPKYKKAIHLDQDSITLASVSYKGISHADGELLLKKSKLKAGNRVTGKDIDEAISMLYSTSAFSSVTYALLGKESPYDMELEFKKGQSNQLGLGFRFDSEEIAALWLNISLNNMRLFGSQVGLTAKLSYNSLFKIDYAYAFKTQLQVNTSYTFKTSDLNIFDTGLTYNNISFYHHALDVNFSSRKLKTINTKAGMKFENFNYRSTIPVSGIPSVYDPSTDRNNFVSVYGSAKIDKLDDSSFPNSGFSLSADYSYYFNWFAPEYYPFGALKFNFLWAISLTDRLVMIPSLHNRSLIGGNVPVSYMNIMGGYEAGRYMDHQIAFMGFNYSYAFRNILSTAVLDARYRFGDNNYVFASINYATDNEGLLDFFQRKGIWGARLGYSYNSIIGPLSFNLHWSNYTSKLGAYLSLGYSF